MTFTAPAANVRRDAVDEIVAAALNDEPVPAAAVERVADAERAAAFAATGRGLMVDARVHVKDKLTAALRNGAGEGVLALRGPFVQVLEAHRRFGTPVGDDVA